MRARKFLRNRMEPRFEIVLIAHNLRSAHNVGSLFRTASGAGVSKIYLTGHTPEPAHAGKLYLTDAEKALHKTALGAEQEIAYEKMEIGTCLEELKRSGYEVVALEQAEHAEDYRSALSHPKVALLVGNEPAGLEEGVLDKAERIFEIPMQGQKNSLNVAVAAGIALYRIRETLEQKL